MFRFFFIIIIIAFSSYAYAQSLSQNSVTSVTYVNGLPPIAIYEAQKLNFGTIASPNTPSWVAVNFNGNLKGNVTILDYSTASAGYYKIFGSNSNTISIKAQDLNTYPYFTFKKIRGKYPGNNNFDMLAGQSNLNPPGMSGKKLTVGAQLKIAANTPDGDYSPGFIITVDYD